MLCKYKQWDTLLLACVSAAQQQHQQQQIDDTVLQSQSATQPTATTHNIIVSALSDAVQASIATSNKQLLSSAVGALWYVLQIHDSSAAQHVYHNSTDVSPESTFLTVVNDMTAQHITNVSSSQMSSSSNTCTNDTLQDLVSQAIVTAVGKSAIASAVNNSNNSHVQR